MKSYSKIQFHESVTFGAKEPTFIDADRLEEVELGTTIERDGDYYTITRNGVVRELHASNVRWAEPRPAAKPAVKPAKSTAA